MKKIAIIGAGELGKLIMCHVENYEIVGFYDDYKKEKTYNNLPILGNISDIQKDFNNGVFEELMIGLGYNHMSLRKEIFDQFNLKIPFANIIHKSAYIDHSVKIGKGVFIFPNVTLDTGVVIGDNVLINTSTTIAHHSKVYSHTFIAPCVSIAGLVEIKEKCFIGIGSIIKDLLVIAEDSIIGAGSLVLKNTENGFLYYGTPAKKVNKLT